MDIFMHILMLMLGGSLGVVTMAILLAGRDDHWRY